MGVSDGLSRLVVGASRNTNNPRVPRTLPCRTANFVFTFRCSEKDDNSPSFVADALNCLIRDLTRPEDVDTPEGKRHPSMETAENVDRMGRIANMSTKTHGNVDEKKAGPDEGSALLRKPSGLR